MPYLERSLETESHEGIAPEEKTNDIKGRAASSEKSKEKLANKKRINDVNEKLALFANSKEKVTRNDRNKDYDLRRRIALCQQSSEGGLPGQPVWTPYERNILWEGAPGTNQGPAWRPAQPRQK